MKKQKWITYSLSFTIYGLFSALILPSPWIATKAASPMPTAVNTANLTDSEVMSYYAGIETKSGDDLLASLHNIIKDHNEYDYESSVHRTIYKIIDRNWELSPLSETELSNFDYNLDNPYIRKLYADYNDDITTADRFKNDGASRVSFDKEHIWAQSLGNFGRSDGAGSDFHSLWPSDVIGNQNAHSNYNYAVPTTSISTYNNDKGSYVGRNGYIAGFSEKVFEPLDAFKGDIARAMFYMPARYYTYENPTHPKLSLVNGSPTAITASTSQAGLAGDLATLLQWHTLDPVDSYEVHRNNLIFNNYQGNRNPFIDYPELATIAYDTTYAGSGATLTPGTSTAANLPDGPVKLSRIEVSKVDANLAYYFYDTPKKQDFVVTAYYSDSSSEVITDYSMSIANHEGLIFSSIGAYELIFTYVDGTVSKTTSLSIEVTLSTTQIILVGAVALVALVIMIAVPSLRKKATKSLKKAAKQSTKKKKTTYQKRK